MKSILTISFSALLTCTAFTQYCMTGGPTSNIDSNVELVQITGASGTINYTGCPGVLGVQDLTTSQVVTLSANGNYNLTVDFGTCGGNYSGVGQAWIDFNLDGVFDQTETVGTWQGVPPVAPSVFNFTVPANAQNGTARLRVIQQEAGTLPINPCGAFTWGSVMDFGVIINGGVDCSSYLGDTKETAIEIASVPYSTTGNNSYCYFNQNLVYNSPDIYYRLIPGTQLLQATVSLCGSNFDTFLSVIDQQGNVIAYNDDGSCGSSSELTFSTVGIDTAYIIVEGWSNETGDFDLNINGAFLGIDENSSQNIQLFPNPAKQSFQVIGLEEEAAIFIRDSKGSLVQSIPSYFANTSIPIEAYQAGIYFVTVKTKQYEHITKLIID
ncbi:MAG: T9SS type A sorting domain-containing protein [Fluviicola sp.]|nr:T9SS type A sorting domain-containing protein [Fluviicola sp.]